MKMLPDRPYRVDAKLIRSGGVRLSGVLEGVYAEAGEITLRLSEER